MRASPRAGWGKGGNKVESGGWWCGGWGKSFTVSPPKEKNIYGSKHILKYAS